MIDPMTTLQIITLVTAIVGAVTGTAALVWGVWQFVLSGSRVKVEIDLCRLEGGLLVGGRRAWVDPSSSVRGMFVRVRVRNRGRFAVDVTGVTVNVGALIAVFPLEDSGLNPFTPHRLNGGSTQDWLFGRDDVLSALDAVKESAGPRPLVRGIANLGTGKSVRSGLLTFETEAD